MTTLVKDWNRHVTDAEEVARGDGFRDLRDRIVRRAEPTEHEVVVDIGSGTGLLALAIAERAESVWALDIAPAMVEYLRVKAASADFDNLHVAVAGADSLPLVDESADVVVSNYCLHHLDERGKRRALNEAYRVLRPGGRLVFGDMMFAVALADARDRQVIASKVRALAGKGPAGLWRLARNGTRFATRRWEQPARAEWWKRALVQAGFSDVGAELLDHEGGIAWGRKPSHPAV